MGALDKIVNHELELRRESAEAKARKVPVEEARRRRERAERYAKIRGEASDAAKRLVGRVIFPARWQVVEGEGNWYVAIAKFDGKIEIRFFWNPRHDLYSTVKIQPVRNPPGMKKRPTITDPTRQQLVDALLAWGLA